MDPSREVSNGSNDHYREEAPVHTVTVDGFWIDEAPVTNRRFAQFVEEQVDARPPLSADVSLTRLECLVGKVNGNYPVYRRGEIDAQSLAARGPLDLHRVR